MREIKFRAWDKDALKMVVPLAIKNALPSQSKQDDLIQFTGLKDKNGKEIYEGDILDVDGREEYRGNKKYRGTFVVESELSGWGYEFHWRNISGYECSTHIMGFPAEGQSQNIEVIGNIYENPDLLQTHA